MQLLWALAGQEPQEQVLLQQVPQEEIVEVLETYELIVSSSVSVMQPVRDVYVPEDVYVNPSTSQVYELQAFATVVLLMIGIIDKSSVITESQPKTVPFGMLKVALLLLDV